MLSRVSDFSSDVEKAAGSRIRICKKGGCVIEAAVYFKENVQRLPLSKDISKPISICDVAVG